uniref:F-box domain-containing protein n=1 Tax=Tetradesmus obliquus TaxID=3088 RepID=A0A383WQF6_TETOB|eukprot:jgi/Sobl393_1/8956/SZX79366.1
MDIESGGTSFEWGALPPELLQVLGEYLSPAELRSARLSCKNWATSLAFCMPAMTMSLPQQASDKVFRQPLVLCSSGQLNSAQSVNYSAAPLPRISHAASAGLSAAAYAAASTSAAAPGLPAAPSLGCSSNSSSPSKPSPFATKGGQAAMRSSIREFTAAGDALPPSPFYAVTSLPPGCLPHREQQHPRAPTHAGPTAAAAAAAAAAASHPALQWQNSGVMQGWSSLPAAGLRTCSSLQQLNLQMSGAPPTPQDLADLSSLRHLTHLSFRQVEQPAAGACAAGVQASLPPAAAAAAGAGSASFSAFMAPAEEAAAAGLALMAVCSVDSLHACKASSPAAGSISMLFDGPWGSEDEEEEQQQPGQQQAGSGGFGSDWEAAVSEYGSSSSRSSGSEMQADEQYQDAADDSEAGDIDDTMVESDQGPALAAAAAAEASADQQPQDAAAAAPVLFGLSALPSQGTECVSCSVITPQHVEALARLPHLSSLELHPKQGIWDDAASAALTQLTMLTGLTQLTLTWGNLGSGSAASSVQGQLSDAEALQQVQGPQLPLQQCLLGLAGQLQELQLNGRAVVDVLVLQRLQKLRKLQAEALSVVNSDVVARLEQQQQQQQGGNDAQQQQQQQHAGGAEEPQQPRRLPKWATLPLLESLHVVHGDSDVSLLLRGTQTPQLSSLGFVSRGPSDFARLLAQHGKLRVLHLVFPEDEPWHPIAVVRLPTALPSLRSLTLEGKFWLPNSLIVALGVMEVPIEHLSLTCKLAPPCLERLQHLTQLQRLSLHHVAWVGHPADGLVTKDVMLQLPAKLLPAGLRELEISNGWILH